MLTRQIIPKLFIILFIITITISGLYLDLAQKQEKLEEEFEHTKNRLIKIEQLINVALGPNKEFPSDTMVTSGYWLHYHSGMNHTSGNPYICVYVPEDHLTFEIWVEVINKPYTPNLTIQRGTPYSGEPIPDLFVENYSRSKERFQFFYFDAPSAGWYTLSVIGHISPKWTGWTVPEFGDRGYYLIDVNARVRLLSVQKAVLFGVGLG